jgi:hypothetical protein
VKVEQREHWAQLMGRRPLPRGSGCSRNSPEFKGKGKQPKVVTAACMRKLIMISNTIVMTGWPWKCFDALCFDLLPNTVARTAQHDAIALSEACPVMHTSGRAQNSDAYVVQLLDRPWGEAERTSKAYAQPQSRPPPAAASGRVRVPCPSISSPHC